MTTFTHKGHEVVIETMLNDSVDKYCYSIDSEHMSKRTGETEEKCREYAIKEIDNFKR